MGLTQFIPKREKNDRLPPGQYLTDDFPILSMSLAPEVSKADWSIRIFGKAKEMTISFEELTKLPYQDFTTDIHCVTKWSKLDTDWRGVSMDTIMELAEVPSEASHLMAHSYDDYTTNLPIVDVKDGKGFLAYQYEGKDLEVVHGGYVRLLVPHLYFWKSAKWLNGLEFMTSDKQGFWEGHGYHNYGDPWKEQRYDLD